MRFISERQKMSLTVSQRITLLCYVFQLQLFIIAGLRSVDVLADQKQKAAMKQDLANAILRRNAKNE
jgi:hypothetical protein